MHFALDDTPLLKMHLSQSHPATPKVQCEGDIVHYEGELVVYDFDIWLDECEMLADNTVSVYLNFSSMENIALVGVEPLQFCKQPTTDTTFQDIVYKIQLRKQDNF